MGGLRFSPASPWAWLVADPFPHASVGVATLAGCLGLAGSLFLILSYCCLPRLRTDHRAIVALISVFDFAQALQFSLLPFYFFFPRCQLLALFLVLGHLTYLPCCVLNVFLAFHVGFTIHHAATTPAAVATVADAAGPRTSYISSQAPSEIPDAPGKANPRRPPRFPLGVALLCCCVLIVLMVLGIGRYMKDLNSLLLGYYEPPPKLQELLPWILQQKSFRWQFAGLYLSFAILCFVAIAAASIFAYARLARRKEWEYNPQLREFKRRLWVVPVIFLVARAPGLLYVAWQAWGGVSDNPGWLLMLVAIGEPSEGFWNSIVFGLLSTKAKETLNPSAVQRFRPRRSEYQPLCCKEAI